MLSELVVVSLTMMLVFVVVVVVVADICLVPLAYDNYITPTTITLLHFVKLVGLLTQDNLAVRSFVPFVISW